MKHNKIRDISVLENLHKLKKIEANHNSIANVESITKLQDLVFLDLAHNTIEDLHPISDIKSLVWLCLEDNIHNVKDDALHQTLKHSLQKLAHFTY